MILGCIRYWVVSTDNRSVVSMVRVRPLSSKTSRPGQPPAGVAAGPVLDRVGAEQGVLAVHQCAAPALEGLQPCDEFGPGSLQDRTLGDGERLCLLEERLSRPERLPPGLPSFGGP